MARTMNHDHHVEIFDPLLARPVTVVGVGSVGSRVVEFLARLGCLDITIWDFDTVASHNVPMSIYRLKDQMKLKVDALADIVQDATGVELRRIPKKYQGEKITTALVCCVDTMEARKMLWTQAKNNPLVGMFIDTRIAGEFLEVFAVQTCNAEDADFYQHFLYPSTQALTPTCGFHGAVHISCVAASIACSHLTLFWKSGKPERHLQMLCGKFQQIRN